MATAGPRARPGGREGLLGEAYGKDPNPYYGRVVYTVGLNVDAPVSIFRLGYADSPTATTYTQWPNFVVMPFWDRVGTARLGAFGNGAAVKQLAAGGTSCVQTTSAQRCVRMYWPASFSPYDLTKGFTPQSYMGSLLELKKNAGGTFFRRARVYDPATGRFTQEDPIGLAGGLNLYGFAGGDPVNFSDPFGLCPWCRVLERAGAVGSAVGRFGQQIATAVRGIVSSPAAQQAAGVIEEVAERVAVRSAGAWDVAVAGGRHAGLLRTYGSRAISEIQTGIGSLEGRVAEHLGKIRDPGSFVPNWTQLDPRAQQGILKFWEKEAVNYAQQAEVLRGMLRP